LAAYVISFSVANVKAAFVAILLLVPLFSQAMEINSCNGTVLQRRVALLQLGRIVDAYVATAGALPDICAVPVVGVSDHIPQLLKSTLVCGSSKDGSVYYSCQLPPGHPGTPSDHSPVIETCRYSLEEKALSCENRSVVTTFEDPG